MLRIGHRGARGHSPENTIASFRKALELGVDMIELDVRKCASGDLICIHDFTLKRLTGRRGRVKKKSLDELQTLDVRGEKIPTLSETLDMINRRVPVNLHLKQQLAEEIYATIRRYIHKGWKYEDFVVSSFFKKDLRKLHHLDRKIRLGYLCIYPRIPRMTKKTGLAGIALYSIHPHVSTLKKKHIERMHDKGLKVFVWTVNKKSIMKILQKWGVDGIISDYPERI